MAPVLLVIGLASGCAGTGRDAQSEPSVARGPLPAYADVMASYNARVGAITRLSSPVSVVIESDRSDGSGRTRDQLDGNLSVMPPLHTALRLDKAGINAAYLGSNDFAYWWFDLSGSEPLAMGGSHLKATREDAKDFGLPVHPLEFIELLAVLPLPVDQPGEGALAWSKDGRALLVSAPSRWGTRRFTLDPVTFEPSAIDLLTDTGKLAVGAKLSAFKPAYIEGKPGVSALVPTKVELMLPENNTRVLLVIASPRIPLKINPRVFELSGLIESYSVKKFIDHDELKRLRRERIAREAKQPGSGGWAERRGSSTP